jgi:hypothetical protein
VIGISGADRVSVEFDGRGGLIGFKMPDFGQADSVQFLERQSARAAVGRQIG